MKLVKKYRLLALSLRGPASVGVLWWDLRILIFTRTPFFVRLFYYQASLENIG